MSVLATVRAMRCAEKHEQLPGKLALVYQGFNLHIPLLRDEDYDYYHKKTVKRYQIRSTTGLK